MAPPTPSGLTEVEAAARLGGRRRPASRTGRSYASIIWANTFNLPNVVLGVLGLVTIAVGEAADALFLGIVVLNAVLGSVQEIRAKHALERLSALIRPFARVVRSGVEREVAAAEVVVGDLVRLQPGDQVVADGTVLSEDHLELDESVLTGESEPVRRTPGEEVRSGSFVVDGSGLATVTAVGTDSYAEQVAGTARAFRHPASPFQQGLGRLILALLAVAVPTALVLLLALWLRDVPFPEALQALVAAVAGMVPEGLILLTSVAYVTGALKMSRRGVLTQQLNALESLASADTLCLDKTGTLTEGRLRLVTLVAAGRDRRVGIGNPPRALRRLIVAAQRHTRGDRHRPAPARLAHREPDPILVALEVERDTSGRSHHRDRCTRAIPPGRPGGRGDK